MPKTETVTAPVVKPHCPKCGSGQVVARKGDGMRWCRICLFEWPVKGGKK
jgi:hypothetical protein